MATLTVIDRRGTSAIPFRAEDAPLLDALLLQNGFALPHPCGGRGECGKCAVNISGAVSEPDDAERRAGKRLSCRTRLLGDATLDLCGSDTAMRIETDSEAIPGDDRFGKDDLGLSCDIGTTTVVLGLYELRSGSQVALASARNPQTAVSADVIGRIAAALDGKAGLLQSLITEEIQKLTDTCLATVGAARSQIKKQVVTGNTAMLYLLTGRSPESLAHAPFRADFLFGCDAPALDSDAYLPPCIAAFVGADITTAVAASGMTEKNEISLLADIGTNGELALFKDGTLYVTSTAAGPAFEGAGISSGSEAVSGAIDAVWLENGVVRYTTIGGAAPRGICGSGIIDAVAALLDGGRIDETGLLEEDFAFSDSVGITQKDIRQVQLAKAAVAAGITCLMDAAGCRTEDIAAFYIAGGFGKHLNVRSAARIGLFPPALAEHVRVLGNAAFRGAARALTSEDTRARFETIRKIAVPVALGGDKLFSDLYLQNMYFHSF